MNTVWLSCEGENPADQENIGPIDYYPRQGFPGYYFPYENSEGYLSPLVAIHFTKPTRKSSYSSKIDTILLECHFIHLLSEWFQVESSLTWNAKPGHIILSTIGRIERVPYILNWWSIKAHVSSFHQYHVNVKFIKREREREGTHSSEWCRVIINTVTSRTTFISNFRKSSNVQLKNTR